MLANRSLATHNAVAPAVRGMPTPAQMQTAARDAAALLQAIANPDRMLILCHLFDGEKSVTALERAFGVRQPTMSQRLAKLRQAGLVETRRDGKAVYYRLSSDEAAQTIALMHELFGRR